MTLTPPIAERITLNVLAALQSIQKVNGYQFDCEAARPVQLGLDPRPDLLELNQGDCLPSSDGHTVLRWSWTQEYVVACYVIQTDRDDTAPEARANALVADVWKALAADRQRGTHPTYGYQLAHDTTPVAVRPIESTQAGAFVGALFFFSVEFDVTQDNFYTRDSTHPI